MSILSTVGTGLVVVALIVLLVRAFSVLTARVTIHDYEVGLLFVSGRLQGSLPPGGHWLLNPFARAQVLDLRTRVVTVPAQEVLTADNVSVKTSLLLRYRIENAEAAVKSATSYEEALYADAQVALREVVGGLGVEELVSGRTSLGAALEERLRPKAQSLGLVLESAGLKDLIYPPALRQVFQQVVEARTASQASLERARGEVATLRSLANAARMLENNPALMSLRTLQTAGDGRHTLVFGAPAILPVTGPSSFAPPTPPAADAPPSA